jgi:hypothetical protein
MNHVEISPISQDVFAQLSEPSRTVIQRLAKFQAGVKLPDLSVSYRPNQLPDSLDDVILLCLVLHTQGRG